MRRMCQRRQRILSKMDGVTEINADVEQVVRWNTDGVSPQGNAQRLAKWADAAGKSLELRGD